MKTEVAGKNKGTERVKPLKPVVVAGMLSVVMGLFVAGAITYWNRIEDYSDRKQRITPYYKLELSSLDIHNNPPMYNSEQGESFYSGTQGKVVGWKPNDTQPPTVNSGSAVSNGFSPSGDIPPSPPVPYLYAVYERKAEPKPRLFSKNPKEFLTENFKGILREIAIPKLDQGGMPLHTGSRVKGNSTLGFNITVKRNAEQKNVMEFSVSYWLDRNIYLTRYVPSTIPLRVSEGTSNTIRVWEKDLETAIIYEFERLIARIVTEYREANSDTKKM